MKNQKSIAKNPIGSLEDFGGKIVKDIEGDRNPKFVTTTRTRSNIVYNDKKGYLSLGPAEEERNFIQTTDCQQPARWPL